MSVSERIKIRKRSTWYDLTTWVLSVLQWVIFCVSTPRGCSCILQTYEAALQLHEASNLTNCGSPVEKRGGSSKCQGNEGTISIVYIETLKLNLSRNSCESLSPGQGGRLSTSCCCLLKVTCGCADPVPLQLIVSVWVNRLFISNCWCALCSYW